MAGETALAVDDSRELLGSVGGALLRTEQPALGRAGDPVHPKKQRLAFAPERTTSTGRWT